jgi:hypothetical protein
LVTVNEKKKHWYIPVLCLFDDELSGRGFPTGSLTNDAQVDSELATASKQALGEELGIEGKSSLQAPPFHQRP